MARGSSIFCGGMRMLVDDMGVDIDAREEKKLDQYMTNLGLCRGEVKFLVRCGVGTVLITLLVVFLHYHPGWALWLQHHMPRPTG